MKITVIDHFRDGRPQVFEGLPLEVEEALRTAYYGVLSHIPMGDLTDCIQTLKRMTGVEVTTEDWIPIRR